MAVHVSKHRTENARANVARAQEVPPHPQKRADDGRCAGSVQDICSETRFLVVRCKQCHHSKLQNEFGSSHIGKEKPRKLRAAFRMSWTTLLLKQSEPQAAR